MVISEIKEFTIDDNIRHIKELQFDIMGWYNELGYAIKKSNNIDYIFHCTTMIILYENIIQSLEKYN